MLKENDYQSILIHLLDYTILLGFEAIIVDHEALVCYRIE
jgi:hypothetical protein